MPVHAVTTRDGVPGYRWGRNGRVHTYGHFTGRVPVQAAALAIRDGRRRGARRLVRDLGTRTLRCDNASRKYGGRVPRFSERLTQQHRDLLWSRLTFIEKLLFKMGLKDLRSEEDLASLELALETGTKMVIKGAVLDAIGLRKIAIEIDEDVTETVDRQVSAMLKRPVVSTNTAGVIHPWVADNVALITSIATRNHAEVEAVIREAYLAQMNVGELATKISQRFDVSRSRGELIARDQTAKLSSRINQERQEAHGIDRYRWSSSGDERVRQRHAELDGRIFHRSDPPVADERAGLDGHPGEVWQCRCDAEPVLPEDSERTFLEEAAELKERELEILQAGPVVQQSLNGPGIRSVEAWNGQRLRALRAGAREAVGLV